MKEVEYRPIEDAVIDPNTARWYALPLCAVAILFAFLTIKTNWDYFGEDYKEAWAFWLRVIPFFAVEATAIILPLFKGFGNSAQGRAALWLDVLLIIGGLTHTYLVADYSVAKLSAGKVKTEATSTFNSLQDSINKIQESNQKLQSGHNEAMARWNDSVRVARKTRRPIPEPPAAPSYQPVPVLKQDLIQNASLTVETAGEARVSQSTLQKLLYSLLGLVAFSIGLMVLLADGSRVRAWLLKQRAHEIHSQISGRPLTLRQPIGFDPPVTRPFAENQETADFPERSSKPGLLRRLIAR